MLTQVSHLELFFSSSRCFYSITSYCFSFVFLIFLNNLMFLISFTYRRCLNYIFLYQGLKINQCFSPKYYSLSLLWEKGSSSQHQHQLQLPGANKESKQESCCLSGFVCSLAIYQEITGDCTMFFVLNQRNPERVPQSRTTVPCSESKTISNESTQMRKKYYRVVETTRLLHNWQLFPKAARLFDYSCMLF